MSEWVIGGVALILLAGIVIAGLMILRNRLLLDRRAVMIDQIESRIIHEYLPAVKDYEVEMFDEFMDMISDKIPDMMEKTMNSAKKMMEV